MITEHLTLTEAQQAAVRVLVARAEHADLASPLNESARMALSGLSSGAVVHWLMESDAELIGYAQLDTRDGSVQLVVDPIRRRQGRGRAVAERVRGSGLARTWWAFGNLPGARGLARALGLGVVRGLLIMTLDLARHPRLDPVALPEGLTIDRFRPEDLDRLVALNSVAFAEHPEQGTLTAADFTARMTSDWHHDDDLLVARDATGSPVGFHWTKIVSSPQRTTGEVYVLAVHPDHAGMGTGRALLAAGIIHMRSRGAPLINLYVEAANDRVVTMYRTAGFKVTHTDVAYGPVEED